MTGARPALRLACRSLWRNKGASLLVLLLIALPAGVGSLISITMRTGVVTAQESWVSQNGLADLSITPRACGVCDGDQYAESPQALERNTHSALRALPTGTETAKSRQTNAAIEIGNGDRAIRVNASKSFDGDDPLTTGMAVLQDGKWPHGAGEIALARGDLDALRATVGSAVSVSASDVEPRGSGAEHTTSARVVGIVDDPTQYHPSLYVQGFDGPVGELTGTQVLYRSIAVKLLAGTSIEAAKRAVAATGAAEVSVNPGLDPNITSNGFLDAVTAGGRWIPTGIVGLMALLGLMVIGLLARTAFAVTARRSRHDIGLAMIAGAKPSQVRLITTAQGAVLGLAGAAVGVAGGFAAFFVLRGWAADAMQTRLDGALAFGQLLWAVAIACVITSMVAAASVAVKEPASPAKTVADSGRPVRHRRWVAIVGSVLLLGGVAGLFAFVTVIDNPGRGVLGRWQLLFSLGAGGDGLSLSPWLCAAAALLGAMLLLPRVLTLLGRLAGRLPASPRLAMRSTVRSASRTGPVLAAVLAITSLGVAGLVALAGSVQAERDQYVAAAPPGIVTIASDATSVAGRKAQQAAIEHAKSAIKAETGATELGEVNATGLRAFGQCDAANYLECGGAYLSEATAAVVTRLAAANTDPTAVARTLAAGGVVAIGDALSASTATTTPTAKVAADPPGAAAPMTAVALLNVAPREPSQLASQRAAFISATGIKHAAAAGVRGTSSTAEGRVTLLQVDGDLDRGRTDALNAGLAPYRVHLTGYAPFQDRVRPIAAIVALLIGLFAVAATVLSVALAMGEQRRDLRVLAAVGARPRQTSNLYATQALIISTLAVIPGAALGGLVGVAATRFLWGSELSIPVGQLAALVLGIPLAATTAGWLWARRASFGRDDRAWSTT